MSANNKTNFFSNLSLRQWFISLPFSSNIITALHFLDWESWHYFGICYKFISIKTALLKIWNMSVWHAVTLTFIRYAFLAVFTFCPQWIIEQAKTVLILVFLNFFILDFQIAQNLLQTGPDGVSSSMTWLKLSRLSTCFQWNIGYVKEGLCSYSWRTDK